MSFSNITLSLLLLVSITSASICPSITEKKLPDGCRVKQISDEAADPAHYPRSRIVMVEVERTSDKKRKGGVWYRYQSCEETSPACPQIITDIDDSSLRKDDWPLSERLAVRQGWILTHINNQPYTKALEIQVETDLQENNHSYNMTFVTPEFETTHKCIKPTTIWNSMSREYYRDRIIDPEYYSKMCRALVKLLEIGSRDVSTSLGGCLDEEEVQQALDNMLEARRIIDNLGYYHGIEVTSRPTPTPSTTPASTSTYTVKPNWVGNPVGKAAPAKKQYAR